MAKKTTYTDEEQQAIELIEQVGDTLIKIALVAFSPRNAEVARESVRDTAKAIIDFAKETA